MESLLPELLLYIFEYVPKLLDKISWSLTTNAIFYVLHNKIHTHKSKFIEAYFKNKSYSNIEKIIYQYCYDGYSHLIDKKHIVKSADTSNLSTIFARYGNVDLMELLHQNGGHINKDSISYVAAQYGQMQILCWAKNNDCLMNAHVCGSAAFCGHFEILKWCYENGCPLHGECLLEENNIYHNGRILDKKSDKKVTAYVNACDNAAQNGHLEIIKWATENGCPWSVHTIFSSVYSGKLEILKWLRENGCEWNATICLNAARNGYLEILQWVYQNGCPWDDRTCAEAAENGHLEILQWVHQNGCPWNFRTCSYAALNGHFEIIKWARENGCDWNCWTCVYAAYGGHLEILQWIRQNDCEWNKEVISYAAESGHLEIIKWATINGCEWDPNAYRYASKNGHKEIVEWIENNHYECDFNSSQESVFRWC